MPSSLVSGPWFRFINVSKKLHLKPQAAAPSNPQMGDVYCNTDGKFYGYNGTDWVVLGTQA